MKPFLSRRSTTRILSLLLLAVAPTRAASSQPLAPGLSELAPGGRERLLDGAVDTLLPPMASSESTDESLRALLLRQLEDAHVFLLSHRRGLPYTDDPRPLEPFSEVIRLQTDSQTLGYLDLYQLTGKPLYLRQARERLDYILALGDSALTGSLLVGQVGYSFLRAYEVAHDRRYLEEGLRIAELCLIYPHQIPNWDYAGALCLGRAHALTGDSRYLEAARRLTRRVASRQFADGAFPHRDDLGFGENSPYTAWLVFEMIQHRRDDPDDPNADPGILKAARFLEQRVNPDGGINYEDAAGSYYSDPFGADPRGWMSELPTMAFIMSATGRDTAAEHLLSFLFLHALDGHDRGGYPDKWGYPDPGNPWASGSPSVLRTSVVFWMLSSCLLVRRSCEGGHDRPCRITPDDCNPSFRDLGVCDAGLVGHDVCIDGRYTRCLDEDLVHYEQADTCVRYLTCDYWPTYHAWYVTICPRLGNRKCIGRVCADTCYDLTEAPCASSWMNHNPCIDTLKAEAPEPVAQPRSPTVDDAMSSRPETIPFGINGIRPQPASGAFDIAFTLDRPLPARLELFDVAGRRLMVEDLAGRVGMGWGRLDPARTLPNGVYLIRLAQAGRIATTRVVLAR
jgi:hypothetical protein